MKKALKIIKNVLVWLVVALAVFMMIFTIVSVNTFNRNDRNLFGYRAYVVLSDSMQEHFPAGSLIFVKYVEPSTLQPGDIISYVSQDSETGSWGETITHMIRRPAQDAEGNPGFITYGTTTGTDDTAVVTYPYIMGEYQWHLPMVGYFFEFLRTPQGYIVCIFVPFMLLILYQGVNFVRLFRRYKKEQVAEMQAERDKIEAERAENARMLEELQALKAQMAAQAAAAAPAEAAPPAAAPAEVAPPADVLAEAAPPADDAKED